MLGPRAGLAALLKRECPWLTVFGCICHSLALCAAAACEKLDRNMVQFSHDVYNFLSFSSKRLSEYRECQVFVKAAKHSILYPSKTRWLVMENVCKRLVEQWDALTLYFQSYLLENCPPATNIYHGLKDLGIKLHYCFLSYILEIVNSMNLEFQSEGVRIHKYLDVIDSGLSTVMDNFISKGVLKGKYCFEIDHTQPQNFKPIDETYFGARVSLMIAENSKPTAEQMRAISPFRIRALEFYIELCSQIKKRVDFRDDFLNHLKCVSPSNALSGKISSVAPLYLRFSSTIHFDIEELDRQWRALFNLPDVEEKLANYAASLNRGSASKAKKGKKSVQKDAVYGFGFSLDIDAEDGNETDESDENLCDSLATKVRNDNVPSSVETTEPSVFWNFLLTQETVFCNFKVIVAYMRFIMCLPHSSASAERQFSHLKLIRSPLRNKIAPSTINALMHIDRYIPDVSKWEVPQDVLKKAKSWKTNKNQI